MNDLISISVDCEGEVADAIRFLSAKGKTPTQALREELAKTRGEIFLSRDGSTHIHPMA